MTVISGGASVANRQVVVAQTNHKFLFGSTGFEFIPLAGGELSGAELEKAELHAGQSGAGPARPWSSSPA